MQLPILCIESLSLVDLSCVANWSTSSVDGWGESREGADRQARETLEGCGKFVKMMFAQPENQKIPYTNGHRDIA